MKTHRSAFGIERRSNYKRIAGYERGVVTAESSGGNQVVKKFYHSMSVKEGG